MVLLIKGPALPVTNKVSDSNPIINAILQIKDENTK